MKKIILKNKPVLFKNKDFQTIMVQVKFPFKRDDKKLALQTMLPSMLHNVCNKYPNEKEFYKKQQELYINGCYCTSSVLVDHSIFTFTLAIPDVYSLGYDMLDEQFDFFSEVIYNPKVHDNKFDYKEFDKELNSLRVDLKRAEQDCYHYASIKAKKAFDNEEVYSASLFNHQEQLDEIDEEKLYNYYLDVIYNNQPMIYVFGNIDQERINDLCNKYIYKNKFSSKEEEIETSHYFPIRDKSKFVLEESNFNNSVLYSFYTIKDMREEDNVLLGTISTLLTSSTSRLLSKKLRDNHDLVYSCYAGNSSTYGILSIVAYIQDKNLEIVRKKIKEVLQSLKDEKMVGENLELLKESFRISLIRQLDDKISLFRNSIVEDLGIDYTDEYYYKKLLEVTPQDISSFVDRIYLDTEYFLKEGHHE